MFTHLHVHSQYSVLDGQASVNALVDKAMADGMPGIALTDHGNMFGIKEFFNYVGKKNGKTRGAIKDLKKEADEAEAKGDAETAAAGARGAETRRKDIQTDLRLRGLCGQELTGGARRQG